MAFRAFVAVHVPPMEPLVALADELAACGGDLNVTNPAKLHFTLSFLGDVPDDATPRLAAALDAAVHGEKTFPLELHGVGAFPNPRNPRVVWAGTRPAPAFDRLAGRARDALAKAGHPGDDKPFRAHLTLARTRTPRNLAAVADFVRRNADRPLPSIPVDEVRLYRSTLGRGGAVHEVLHAARLEA